MEDCKIVELYWSRDEVAIKETDRKYGRYLNRVAYNILADLRDSEESVNDAYLHAWNSMPPQRPGVLSSYLARITRCVSIDRYRKRNREKRRGSEYALSLSELEECLTTPDGPEETVELQELTAAIETFLWEQSEQVRNLFVGRYYYLDSLKAVARYCGVQHKTFIKVDEKGTEAGAATAVVMNPTESAPPADPKEVILDRPFLYLLIDCDTNTPFFIGSMMDPTA